MSKVMDYPLADALNECRNSLSLSVRRLVAEVEALQARLNAEPTPEAILLQARKPDGGPWTDIFPAQLSWMANEGYEVRALDKAESRS